MKITQHLQKHSR